MTSYAPPTPAITATPDRRNGTASKVKVLAKEDVPFSKDGDGNKNALPLPPHTVETEEILLGAVLMNPETMTVCRTVLGDSGRDFFIVRHGWIWETFVALHEAGTPIDNRILAEALRVKPDPTGKHANLLEAVGGEAYLNWLPGNVPTALHADLYAEIIERAALRRELLGVAGEISALAYDEDRDLKGLLAQAESSLKAVTHRLTVRDFENVGTLAAQTLDEILRDTGEVWPTSFVELDRVLGGGLEPERLNIWAGRPGMGKTTMMTVTAFNMAYRYRHPVLIVSLEMSKRQLMHRIYSRLLRLPRDRFNEIRLSERMKRHAKQAKRVLEALPIWINDVASATPMDIHLLALQMERAFKKKPVIFIDHLQRASSGNHALDYSDRDFGRVSLLARAYKNMAKDLGTSVVVLSQLNRDVENRQDKRPQLSDLRQSGVIEEEADTVLFLYRPYYYLSETGRQSASELSRLMLEVDAAKVRDGAPKTIYLKAMLEHNAIFNTAWGGDKRDKDLGIDWKTEAYLDEIGASLYDGLAMPAYEQNASGNG